MSSPGRVHYLSFQSCCFGTTPSNERVSPSFIYICIHFSSFHCQSNKILFRPSSTQLPRAHKGYTTKRAHPDGRAFRLVNTRIAFKAMETKGAISCVWSLFIEPLDGFPKYLFRFLTFIILHSPDAGCLRLVYVPPHSPSFPQLPLPSTLSPRLSYKRTPRSPVMAAGVKMVPSS